MEQVRVEDHVLGKFGVLKEGSSGTKPHRRKPKVKEKKISRNSSREGKQEEVNHSDHANAEITDGERN